MNAPASPPSPYSSAIGKSNIESHTLSVLVDNEPGVLARVVGLFSGRGYNIESLTVAEVAHAEHLSRITIVTTGTPEVIEQICHQLERIVPIHKVTDLTVAGKFIQRELAMIKVAGKGENRVEALRLAEAFRAKVIDATTRELRVRADRLDREDRRFRRTDAPARPGRSLAHRRRRHFARAEPDLIRDRCGRHSRRLRKQAIGNSRAGRQGPGELDSRFRGNDRSNYARRISRAINSASRSTPGA